MRRHPHKLSLNNKTLSTREQAKKLKKKVYAIVDKANSEFSAERRVSRRAATLVVKKSLVDSVGLEYSLREYRALKALSEFINLAHNNKSITASVNNFTDLLPVGHPSSTKKHTMTASAFTHARLRWVLADPRIPFEAKPLVASVLVDAPDSESYIYSLTRLESDPDSSVPLQSLIAAFGDGNSSAARSLRARMQRRDRYGRFAFMGGGMRALIERARGAGIYSFTADPVAETDDGIVVETPDGVLRKIKVDANVKNLPGNDSKADLPVEFIKARLELKDSKDGFSPTPARVKTGDPVIKEEDLEILDMPPGFRKDDSYKGPGEKYTDDAYDVIKHDKPSPETRTRIEKATKALDAADRDLIQDKKGEDGKIWDADRPVYEISRRGAKTPFAFTQSWADTQDQIADDEPKMDFEEGRAQAYIPRRDPNDIEEEKVKELLQKQEEEQPEAPAPVETEQPEQVEGFDFKVPQDSYALNTFGDYEPEGKTDQEAEDYTDDPEVLSEKFTSEELNGALVEALYPSVVDSDETTDIVDAIESDDPEAFPAEDMEEPTAEDLEDIQTTEEPIATVVNAATGYGTLSFDGGDELVPAEAIYHALKKQGMDADRSVARIYDDIDGTTENIDALTESRGGVEETDIADVIEEVDTEEPGTPEPWTEDWSPAGEEIKALEDTLAKNQQFIEHGGYTFFRNETGNGGFSEEISIYEGSWEPGSNQVATLLPDGQLDWESDEQFDANSEGLWNAFESLATPELPSLIANLSEEDFAKFQETKDHTPFLPENLTYASGENLSGSTADSSVFDFSRDAFFPDQWISLGDDEERPSVTTNPFEISSLFTTDSLELGLSEALSNTRTGTSEFTFVDENGEETSIDMPFEAIRDALQLQGVDTDDLISDLLVENNIMPNTSKTMEEQEKSLQAFIDSMKSQKEEKLKASEELASQKDASAEADTKADDAGQPLSSLPSAEELPTPIRGKFATIDLKPGDVSVKDGFVITEIGDRQIGGKYGAMRKVKGYFPGHQEQDTKQWYEDTPIEIYRGIPTPPKGDLPPLSKTDIKKGKITQEEYDAAITKAKSLVQEPDSISIVNSPNAAGSEKESELSTDNVDAPDKNVSPKPFSRPRYPAFQGRFAELVREAEGDPEKFKELLNNEEYIIFDYETTGLDVNDPSSQPFQLSAIKVKNGEVTDRFNVFMKPDASLTEWNTKNSVDEDGNPLTQEWIDSQKSRSEGHREFLDWAGADPLLSGFNVGFDEDFLRKNSDEAGLNYSPSGIMDARALAVSSLWGDKSRPKKVDAEGNPVMHERGYQMTDNTLKALSTYFDVKLDNWHDSRADIDATKGVLEAALDKSIANKKDKRKVSAFDVDARMGEYLKDINALETVVSDENKVVDTAEAEHVGAPEVDAQSVINSDSQIPLENESFDTYSTVKASELSVGDIAIRPNEAFVITGIAEDPEDTDKMIVNGYYPGHEMQERSWKKNTKIDVVRGVPENELPAIGDGPSLERPIRSGKYRPGNKEYDRDEAAYKRRVVQASSSYIRNPLNNTAAAKTREDIKITDANTPEGRTVEWIRNSDNTQLLVGARASDIKEGDYVRTSLPGDPVVYGYVTKAEFNEPTNKMDYTIVDTNDGTVSNPSWNYFARMEDVRRPLRPQERVAPRPLDIANDREEARFISSDGKTSVKEGDRVIHSSTGVSGTVTRRMKQLGDEPQSAETVDFVTVTDDSGDQWIAKANQLSLNNKPSLTEQLPEPEGVIDQDSGFERQREERMEQSPPTGEDTAPASETPAKKTGFTDEEKKEWKDSKVEGIINNVVDSIIASLDKGEIPWRKGWSGGSFFPTNASTGKEYKGLNIFSLLLAQEQNGYSTNRWIGKKQGEGMGGKLKEDQEGTEILVPKIIKVKVKDKEGKEVEEPRVVGFNFAVVYNVDQFDGLNLTEPEKKEPVPALDAENQILELYKDRPKIVHREMSSNEAPHWTPTTDVITLPNREQFDSSEQLLETLLHELAHSTGHPKRLKRDLLDTYSQHRASRGEEELIADMTAAMVASHLGVDIDLENTAAYVQSWLKALENDRSFIYRAATQASKAMDYMLGNLGSYGKSGKEIAQEKEGEAK